VLRRKLIVRTSDLIEAAKAYYGIITPNDVMTDKEIRKVVKIAARKMSTRFYEHGPLIYRTAITDMMLFLTLMEFPEFYKKYELAQFN
jgi:hypothetical protein